MGIAAGPGRIVNLTSDRTILAEVDVALLPLREIKSSMCDVLEDMHLHFLGRHSTDRSCIS